MTSLATRDDNNALGARIEEVLVQGNLAQLSPPERVEYYNRVCESIGVNPFTRPFEYITLNGKLTLYAKRDAADQLRKIHGINIEIVSQSLDSSTGLYTVHVRATDKSGRVDEDMGVVAVGKKAGEDLANGILKTVTKAKRRVTLSIAGLGFLDETEVEDIPERDKKPAVQMPTRRAVNAPLQAQIEAAQVDTATGEVVEPEERWTMGELSALLKGNGLTVKTLELVVGGPIERDRVAEAIDGWLDAHPGQTLANLIGAALVAKDEAARGGPPFE